MLQDIRYALRSLGKQPGFTAVAVLTLALGIGATTGIFSVVHGVLLRPLRYPDADRLVTVRHAMPGLGLADAGQSGGTYQHYRRNNRVFEEMGIYFEEFFNLIGEEEPERIRVALVTPSVLTALGARPQLGRLLTAEDDAAGAETGVLISHDLWTRRLGGDPGVIGRTIRVVGLAGERNPAPRPVVGVMPPGFDFPHGETDVWYSIRAEGATRANLRNLYLTGIARLRSGVTPGDAEADLRRLVPRLADAYADATPELLQSSGLRPVVRPLKAMVVGDIAATLWIVLGGVALVLMIACANVANLFLVRADHREREAALREALGARRGEMARYFLGESAAVSAVGGLLGVAIAAGMVRLMIVTGPGTIPRLDEVGLHGSVLAFAALITALAALPFGALPLLRRDRPALTDALKEGRGVMPGGARQRFRRILVVSQMALALVLLIGSGLMVQSLRRLQQVDLGFDPQDVMTFQPAMSFARYPGYRAAAGLQVRLLERLRALPGVVAAEAVSDLPLVAGAAFGEMDFVTDQPGARAEVGLAGRVGFATPGYFDAMGIPFQAGRTFRSGELLTQAPPAVLSAGFARTLFRGEDPVGRWIRFAEEVESPGFTVVGVVGDVAGARPGSPPASTVYFPVLDDPASPSFRRVPREGMNVVLRTGGSVVSLLPALRAAVAEMDPDLPISGVRTMEQLAADSTARHRFAMLLLSIAALASLFLGAVGLYGAISYVVSRRTREIGVRMVLGARAGQVTGLVVRQGAVLALTGLAIGIPAAAVLTRSLRALLFEVSPTDPLIFLSMSAALLAVALLASYLPARRAARVDPMEVLRHE